MSIGTAPGEPLESGASFEDQWASARSGTLAGPASQPVSGGGTPEPATPATPVETPGTPTAPAPASPPVAAQAPVEPAQQPQTPQPFQLPDQYQARLREVGASNLDEALTYARNFQSLKGQLPNLEARWRQQYVAPLEQERDTLREERRQALERLVTHDPQTGQERTPEQQAFVRQQIAGAEALQRQQQTEAQTRQQEQAELEAARQQLALTQQQTQEQAQVGLRMTALNAIPLWKQQLVQQTGVPLSELDAYTAQFGYDDRIKGMSGDGFRQVGSMLESLQQYAVMRQGQRQQEQAQQANASQRYRDVGTPAGTGGQSQADRWEKASGDDFQSAWDRALKGQLV